MNPRRERTQRREKQREQDRLNRRLAKLNDGVRRGLIDNRTAQERLVALAGPKAVAEAHERVEAAMAAPAPREEDTMIVGGKKVDLSNLTSTDRFDRFVVTEDKRVFDLELGVEVALEDVIEVDGRKIRVGDFGASGFSSLFELYEGFLVASANCEESIFSPVDGSHMIVDFVKDSNAKKVLQSRFAADGTLEQFIDWSRPNVTLEMWLEWTAATIRWRIKWQLEHRLRNEIDIRSRETMVAMRDALELTIIVVEKFLALTDRQKAEAL